MFTIYFIVNNLERLTAKLSTTQSIARHLCESWVSC